MKSQLSLQNKPIPIDIESLAANFMSRNKKKCHNENEVLASNSKDEEIEI